MFIVDGECVKWCRMKLFHIFCVSNVASNRRYYIQVDQGPVNY